MADSNELTYARNLIRDVPNYPSTGILFRDLTPMIADGSALRTVVDVLGSVAPEATHFAGLEARGFIFASAIAARLEKGCILLRKPNKLPREKFSVSYQLEYGTDAIEIHKDALTQKDRVLIVDDVLATGGTLCAAIELLAKTPATCLGSVVVAEIAALNGRERIASLFPTHQIAALFTL
jgi:adenine phosphoribosyltransferase